MALRLITAPTKRPVPFDDIYQHLRLQSLYDATTVQRYASSAVASLEGRRGILHRALLTQTWEITMSGFPSRSWFELPLPPLQSVTSIKYQDVNDAEQTLAGTVYAADVEREPGIVYLLRDQTWPQTYGFSHQDVVVRFVAGFGDDAHDIPQDIRQAIIWLTADMYRTRETIVVGTIIQQLGGPIEALIERHRIDYRHADDWIT